MLKARRKTSLVSVWQHDDSPVLHLPTWVGLCTDMHGDGLMFVDNYGAKRIIKAGEWLVMETPSTILLMTDIEFRAVYELV